MKVLVLSRNYPNSATQLLGLWVQGPVVRSKQFCETKVVAPVPYCPPIPGLPDSYRKFRSVQYQEWDQGVEVFHPRFLSGPGYSTYQYEAFLYEAAINRLLARIWRTFPFDLIHAYFTYPDGVVANTLGRKYGVPVVITEHIPWESWGNGYRTIQERAAAAVRQSSRHISVSRSVRDTIEKAVGSADNLTVVPNGVDGTTFRYSAGEFERPKNQILFAGAVRPVKGADVLLSAVRILKERGCDAHVNFAGEAFYRSYQNEELRLKGLVVQFGIEDRVHFLGKKKPAELAELMANSSVLVLPSRAESFGVVLAEALSCGTPVVSTTCGGPADIVNERVGVLVPPEDPAALANAITHVLEHSGDYPRSLLRAYALERFGLDLVARQLETIYRKALDASDQRATKWELSEGRTDGKDVESRRYESFSQ